MNYKIILSIASMFFIVLGAFASVGGQPSFLKNYSTFFWVCGIIGTGLSQVANHLQIKKLKKALKDTLTQE